MSEFVPKRSRLEELAQLVEQDLMRRGLAPGDPYLTAQEVGELFGAHPRQANRAMNLLAERDLLRRKPAVGTVAGPGVERFATAEANALHILIGEDRLHSGLRTDTLLKAFSTEMPGTEVKFTVISEALAPAELNAILDRSADDHHLLGIVIIGCGRQVQEGVARRHLPAVVFGSVFPSTSRLSSLDLDQHQIGFLLAERLLDEGCEQLAVVTHHIWLPGDNAFVDGIHAAFAAHDKPLLPPTIRACAVEPKIIDAEVRHLMSQESSPHGLICRTASIAEVALQAAPGIPVVYDDPDPRLPIPGATCLVQPACSFLEQTRQLAKLLHTIARDQHTHPQHLVIPVELAP